MKKIKILHVIAGKTFSGEEAKIYSLCQFYDRQKFDVHVIVFWEALLAQMLREIGITVHVAPMGSRFDMKTALLVAKTVRKHKIDLIISHTARTAIVARIAHIFCRAPVITVLPAPVLRDTNSLKPKVWNFRLERLTSRLTVKYATVNAAIRNELITFGENPEKIRVIYNGIDLSKYQKFLGQEGTLKKEFGLGKTDKLVGMLAAFRPRKGTEYLIKAIPAIIKKVPDAFFAFVGHGDWVEGKDYIETLRELTGKCNVSEKTFFPGFKSDVIDVITSFDIFVLPSIFGEGSSIALMEAMALERPIVSTNTEGNNEVVEHGVTGLLVPPKDENALANAIITLLQDESLASKMGRAGNERAYRMFRIETMTRNHEDLYAEVLGINKSA